MGHNQSRSRTNVAGIRGQPRIRCVGYNCASQEEDDIFQLHSNLPRYFTRIFDFIAILAANREHW